MRTATYSNHGPMRGRLVFIRPEVSGKQLWRVVVRVQRELGGHWSQVDESVIRSPEPVLLGVMRETVFSQIREAVAERDDCRVSMEFFAQPRRQTKEGGK